MRQSATGLWTVWCVLTALLPSCADEVAGLNRRPVAVAPADQDADIDQPVFLDGSGSFDPDGDELGYRWQVVAGTSDAWVVFENSQTELAKFTAHGAGVWFIRLVVDDGSLDSDPAITQVRVQPQICEDDSDCDDGDVCTVDSCSDGICQSQAGNDGAACDDSDPCSMNDLCSLGRCSGDPLDFDRDGYVSAVCQGDDCNDSDPSINPGTFEGPAGNPICGDQVDNDCDGATDSLDQGCESCTQDSDCDDGNICNGTETCVAPNCMPGTVLNCDDNNLCTKDECGSAVGCTNIPLADGVVCGDPVCVDVQWMQPTCVGGQCLGSEMVLSCDDGQACTTDRCGTDAGCVWESLQNGTACDDGAGADGNRCNSSCQMGVCSPDQPANQGEECVDSFSCSSPDYCDGNGQCLGDLNHGQCSSGQLCLPLCATDPSGCVDVPASMDLMCDDPIYLSQNYSDCTLDLGGGRYAGLAACLACEARIAITVLSQADFENNDGDCSLDGWELAPNTDNQCVDALRDCNPGNPTQCCDEFGTICTEISGRFALRSDKAQNCDGGREEWRLFKFFNTRGLHDLRVCFEYAEHNATDDDTIMVIVADPNDLTNADVIFCQDDGPATPINDFFYRYCADVPIDYENQQEIVIGFALHSNNNDDILYLANVEVTGWGGGCNGGETVVLQDDFNDCDLSQWAVGGDSPDCPGAFDCDGSNNLGTGNDDWTIRMEDIDASGLDSHVELCFDHGDHAADSSGEYLTASYDVGNDWQTAWHRNTNFGLDDICRTVCVNLSELEPAVNNHPSLRIRIRLHSDRNDDNVVLDNVVLKGASYCPADPQTVLLNELQDQGDGSYTFQAIDVGVSQMTTEVRCYWGSDPSIRTDYSSIWFRP
jgi:hypothetical protein